MNQLQFGIKTELEHASTIRKIKSLDLSPRQAATLIAKDHLKEDKNYYRKLCKIEGNCGGLR